MLPLHGSLPAEEQDRALRPSDRRKIILSTNVAETSLTIDGVTTVIDSGLARIVRYDGARGIDRWETVRISRAAADQRAGRAGRTGPGHLHSPLVRARAPRPARVRAARDPPRRPLQHRPRACTPGAFATRVNSIGSTLRNPSGWPRPSGCCVLLGGLDGDPPRITPLGEAMLALPVHPRLARLLVAASECGRAREVRRSPLFFPRKTSGSARLGSRLHRQGTARLAVGAASDILDRLDLLAEAEAARFAPSLAVGASIPPLHARSPAARRFARARVRSHKTEAKPQSDLDDGRRAAQVDFAGLPRSAGQTPWICRELA